MSKLGEQLKEEVERIPEEPLPELASEPTRIETEDIFDPELLNRPDPEFLEEMSAFMSDPMHALLKILTQSLEVCRPRPLEPIKSEHKIKIFRLNDQTVLAEVGAEIEAILNEGYCCHIPTVCNDFLIMDFSRRKEEKDDDAV